MVTLMAELTRHPPVTPFTSPERHFELAWKILFCSIGNRTADKGVGLASNLHVNITERNQVVRPTAVGRLSLFQGS